MSDVEREIEQWTPEWRTNGFQDWSFARSEPIPAGWPEHAPRWWTAYATAPNGMVVSVRSGSEMDVTTGSTRLHLSLGENAGWRTRQLLDEAARQAVLAAVRVPW